MSCTPYLAWQEVIQQAEAQLKALSAQPNYSIALLQVRPARMNCDLLHFQIICCSVARSSYRQGRWMQLCAKQLLLGSRTS